MSREQPALGVPPDELGEFPSARVDQRLWKVGRRSHASPWWFSCRTANPRAGRFDLAAPYGTCYLSDDVLGALLEVLTSPGSSRPVVSVTALGDRVAWQLALPEPVRAADATERSAAGFGVTRELGVLVPYALPQAWADAFAAAGFHGIRYWLRLDPGLGRGVAVFGPQGARPDWPVANATPATAWREALEQQAGIRVLDVPALDELDLSADP